MVTGGAHGIGRAISLEFARGGSAVAVAGRDLAALDVVRWQIEAHGVDALAEQCDVGDVASMEAFGGNVLDRFGPPRAVVACAGIAGPTKPMHEIEPAEWYECINIDLTGVFLTFRQFIPAMIARGSGSLIAISSATGKRPLAGRTPYAAAKLGVIGLVRTLALELGPHGIRVNSVCPGGVEGPRIDNVFEHQAQLLGISAADARLQMTEHAALKRLVTPEEVARTCAFLSSEAGSGITGEDLNVSAGLVMY